MLWTRLKSSSEEPPIHLRQTNVRVPRSYTVGSIFINFYPGILIFAEWRFCWPRYRRVTLGLGTFVVNSIVLLSIFLMILTAVMAAPALLHHAK